MSKIRIAIDGPSGAGKSTISKYIAKKLGIIYLDTGAMYRAAALKALIEGADVCDEKKIKSVIENMKIDISYKNDEMRVFLDNFQ